MERYGIDLQDCIVRAKRNGKREAANYLAAVKGWEDLGDGAHQEDIQFCYDALAQFYSATNGGQAWQGMDVDVKALKRG